MRICSPRVPRLKHEWNHTVGWLINLRCGTADGEESHQDPVANSLTDPRLFFLPSRVHPYEENGIQCVTHPNAPELVAHRVFRAERKPRVAHLAICRSQQHAMNQKPSREQNNERRYHGPNQLLRIHCFLPHTFFASVTWERPEYQEPSPSRRSLAPHHPRR